MEVPSGVIHLSDLRRGATRGSASPNACVRAGPRGRPARGAFVALAGEAARRGRAARRLARTPFVRRRCGTGYRRGSGNRGPAWRPWPAWCHSRMRPVRLPGGFSARRPDGSPSEERKLGSSQKVMRRAMPVLVLVEVGPVDVKLGCGGLRSAGAVQGVGRLIVTQ